MRTRTTVIRAALGLALVTPLLTAQTDLTPYASNPILSGDPGKWDRGAVMFPEVVLHEGTYYLFYAGVTAVNQPGSIGLATSSDGTAFTRHSGNPIFTRDGSGFDADAVGSPRVLVEDDGTWVMYYQGAVDPCSCPVGQIGRAVADKPEGPYSRLDAPILMEGGPGEWDGGFIYLGPVLRTAAGYVLYYSGAARPWWQTDGLDRICVGMATSEDGISWTKYDDPDTSLPPFAESDPVFVPADAGWDSLRVGFPAIVRDGTRWDMVYQGLSDGPGPPVELGYATSLDGIHWVRSHDNPVVRFDDQPWWTRFGLISGSLLKIGAEYSAYYTGAMSSEFQIGVAFGPETEDLFLEVHPDQVSSGGDLALASWQGGAGDPVLLAVTGVNGAPHFLPMLLGSFDGSGVWEPGPLPVNYPPELAGTEIALQAFAPGRFSHKVVVSNAERITL